MTTLVAQTNTATSSIADDIEMLKKNAADVELEHYDFGEGVVVVGHNSWDSSDKNDFIKVVYVEFDDAPSEDSHKVSFHVRFSNDLNSAVPPTHIDEVYGLLISNGTYIGERVKV